MPWFQTLRNKLVGDRQKAWQEAAPEVPVDDAAKEQKYQDELKGLRLRMGYGTITKEQYDQQSQDLNKKYGKE